MARPVEWYQHLPQILARLADPSHPDLLSRQSIQELFGVERRNAQYLLLRFGATRVGNTLVLHRQALATQLQTLATQDDFDRQLRRQERVRTVISDRRADLKLARIRLREPVAPEPSALPSSIRLSPGHLSIEFTDVVDLLSQLLELSRAVGADFERFEGMLNQDPLLL